jgi:hypothetical protein
MILHDDKAQVEARFSSFGDSANLDARLVHDLRRTYHKLKSFWMHPIELRGDEAQVNAHFNAFGDSANLNAREVHDSRRRYHRLRNHFRRTPCNS